MVCLGEQIIFKRYSNIISCTLVLILFVALFIVHKKYNNHISYILMLSFDLFVFSAGILGEVYGFYVRFKNWDIILHTFSGFLCASLGLSLINLFSSNIKLLNLKPLLVAIFTFCFSMTIAVFFEFSEYGLDMVFKTDHQKDTFTSVISSISLDESKNGKPKIITKINKTVLYDQNNKELEIINGGYLDIGLGDTMSDLMVNVVGAFTYSFLSYFYIKKQNSKNLASKFIIKC